MYQTIICKSDFENAISVVKENYDNLSESGSLFVISSTSYDDFGNVTHDFLDVISSAIACGYNYINTIVYPSKEYQSVTIDDNVRYVIWLCKNPQKFIFDKDVIREKHIWKDVEWGKRAKNYNPKGKDPGNVWIPTEDDGNANITNHIMLSDSDVISKLLDMSCCKENYLLVDDEIPLKRINNSNVVFNDIKEETVSGKVIFSSSEKMSQIKNCSVRTVITSPPYWNLKDYFKNGQIGQESYETYLSRTKSVWKQCYDKLTNDGSLWININIRVQKGKVILIPHDFVKICKQIGFYYKGILIWHKSSGIPTSEKNIGDHHEYVLVFSKNKNYVVNKNLSKDFSDYKNIEINGKSFWNINRKAGSVGKKYIHPAIYPNALVERIVGITSNKNDVILDPFLGSGTSLIASLNCCRNFIGYEFNEGFEDLMRSRFENEVLSKNIIFEKE